MLNQSWAKLEILGGLLAVGLGNLAMVFWCVQERGSSSLSYLAFLGIGLFVLGGYLTLAGHRSHGYQSQNNQTAYLLEQLRSLKNNP
jgi:hypothetical protein